MANKVVYEWYTKHYQHSSDKHSKLVLRRLEKYFFPCQCSLNKDEISELLHDMDNYHGSLIVKTALLILAKYMKMRRDHFQTQGLPKK